LSIHWNFVTAPYAVSGISPVKLFFDNGLGDVDGRERRPRLSGMAFGGNSSREAGR
jgi:hypothetical protein